MEKWETKENAEIVLKVREAQIQQLYGQTWSGLTGIMIIMFSVCVALRQVGPHWKLLLWSGTLVRLRRAGRKLFVHVELAPPDEITLVEIHNLQSQIEAAIRAARPETLLVTFGH